MPKSLMKIKMKKICSLIFILLFISSCKNQNENSTFFRSVKKLDEIYGSNTNENISSEKLSINLNNSNIKLRANLTLHFDEQIYVQTNSSGYIKNKHK